MPHFELKIDSNLDFCLKKYLAFTLHNSKNNKQKLLIDFEYRGLYENQY